VEGGLLSRSKSASSVTNLGTAAANVGTSSLSLNDVEVLEQTEASNLEGTSDLWERNDLLTSVDLTARKLNSVTINETYFIKTTALILSKLRVYFSREL
jgi:hypothetical protein